AVRFRLRHILCNRLTCSLVCSCRNPSAVTFLYMCQTISFSKSSRDAPAALASLIAFFARSSSVGCEAKMRSWSPKHAGTRSRQSIFQASIILASLSPNPLPFALHRRSSWVLETQSVERGCMEREAHRTHTEALGSSAQMRCVSCWYRQSRVTAKSTSRTPRTTQILMRIRAALPPVHLGESAFLWARETAALSSYEHGEDKR